MILGRKKKKLEERDTEKIQIALMRTTARSHTSLYL